MKISLNWVEQLIGQKLDRQKAIDLIGARLAEVESVLDLKEVYKDVVVADIVSAEPHPDADKLGVYIVNNGQEELQVVAGDRRLAVGDKVAHLPVGSVVPVTFGTEEPVTLEKRPLRGKDSNGMLASEYELSFSEEHAGVLKLDTEAEAGTPFYELYDLNDVIIEVENKTLTHRPDCFGLLGFAREVAAIHDIKFKSPDWYSLGASISGNNAINLVVDNQVPELCPRYMAVVIDDIKVGPSDIKTKSLLNRLGVRPINNIVDISNLYMLLTGQPTHFFDYDKLADGKIIVRKPNKGEKLELLDGKTIEPHTDAVMICDSSGPIALGGVMGGANTEVSETTTKVVLEVANFDMYSIRTTSMKHGIFSEAVTRFSRGQSPQQCAPVITLITNELVKSSAKVASDVADAYKAVDDKQVNFDASKINSLLGTNYELETVVKTLEAVEMEVDESSTYVTVPFWRKDLNIWEDIAEEVGRIQDFSSIDPTLPKRSVLPKSLTPLQGMVKKIRYIMANSGANELTTYNGVSEKVARLSGSLDNLYKIRNSRSPELEYMKGDALPSLLQHVHKNHKNGYDKFAIYEIATTHYKSDIDADKLPTEHRRLAFVFSADIERNHSAYFEAKHYLENLAKDLGLESFSYKTLEFDIPILLKPRAATVLVEGQVVGVIGEFNSSTRKQFKLPKFSAGFEINIEPLVKAAKLATYKKLPKFPQVDRDLTYEVSNDTSFESLISELGKAISQSSEVEYKLLPVDVYREDGSSKKRLTFNLSIWHNEKTLDSNEVNQLINSVNDKLASSLSAKQI